MEAYQLPDHQVGGEMSENTGAVWALFILAAVGYGAYQLYEQHEAKTPPTLEQQRICAEQADKYFKRDYDSSSVYFDHYDTNKNKCFIQVNTIDNSMMATNHTMFVQKEIFDAFEGTTYGTYSDGYDYQTQVRTVSECHAVTSDDKPKNCASEKEWDALTDYAH
jgi:hypothetical protein